MMEGEAPRVTLPGTLYRRGDRWWWSVKLPGEDKARSRPLKETGAKAAVRDRAVAEALALALWEQRIREQAVLQIRVESSQKIAALKAQFLDKVRQLTEVVETVTARAEAEARARAQAEAARSGGVCSGAARPLGRLTSDEASLATAHSPAPAGVCDCCGSNGLAVTELTRIDSGQRLCPRCLAALRADAARIPSSVPPTTPAAQRPPTAAAATDHTTA
jgi:hypothetical protein